MQIKQGDIFYCDLNPYIGSEQGGIRPVLVIQGDIGNFYSNTVIIAAITSRHKTMIPTHVEICGCGLREKSTVLLEQLRTVDKLRLRERIGHVPPEIMEKVMEKLDISFGRETKNENAGGDGMYELQIFSNPKFGKIRTVPVNGKTHFIARDITTVLGYQNHSKALSDHCRWVTKCYVPHPQSPDKTIEVNVIPKGDIYRLAANSELPGAAEFESWVFDEVLPSIDETGGYIPKQDSDTDEDILAKAVLIAKKTIEKKNQIIAEKDEKIKELTPDADFGKAIKNNDGLILVRDYVKVLATAGINIRQHELFKFLSPKYLYRNSHDDYIPRIEYVEQGLFKVIESPVETKAHGSFISYTTKLTGKAQKYFYEKLKEAQSCQLQ